MNELLELLQLVAKEKGKHQGLFRTTEGGMSEHAMGIKPLALKIYALNVLAGIGKDKEPLTLYDGDLQVMLNDRKFFSTNIGLHFDNQRTRVLNDIMHKRGNGTFLFTDIYGLQKAETWRPRLWTVNFSVEERVMVGRVIFGHCNLFPMLSYEILGVTVVGEWMRKMTALKGLRWEWFFHSITNKTVRELEPVPMFKELPELNEVLETLRLENSIRNFKPKLTPIPNTPLPAELDNFVKELHKHWSVKK